MFLWRNLPPGALIAALRSLMAPRKAKKTAPVQTETPQTRGDAAEQEQLDRAVIEIQSRL